MSAADKAGFEVFVNRALDWLEAEVRRVRIAEIEAAGILERAAPLLSKALERAGPGLANRAAGMRLIKPNLTINDMVRLERRAENGQLERSGPTSSDDAERAQTPTARAARDVDWMRLAIFPRFWPGNERRTLSPKAEEIAARRQSTTAKAVKSWRENDKPR
ncbi:hypothetical protein [Sphingomonas sp.]|uniref:hypothetical protein n=1 Tax=Sphingomonas sp. TaxID=28214 RepID=UPI002DD6642B|nr:hypothetical protein [Sphingomonas sp.]